jgi:hypothetical protein
MAAADGIELAALEVRVDSHSDVRGLLGMSDAAGAPVHAGPSDLKMHVSVDAPGVAPERLRALIEGAVGCSPVPSMVRQANSLQLQLDIAGA